MVAHSMLILADLQYALRLLRKRPGFTLACVLTLALGVGAVSIVFSLVNSILFQLPFQNPERLVTLWTANPSSGVNQTFVSAPDFKAWQQQTTVFDGMALLDVSSMVLNSPGEPQRVQTSRISSNFFHVLGISPVLGRSFLPEDEKPDKQFVALISESLWRQLLHGDAAVVGSTINLESKSYTIVGVMPDDARRLYFADIWIPLSLAAGEEDHGAREFVSVAKLRHGASVTEAKGQLQLVSTRLESEFPASNKGWRTRIVPLREHLLGDTRSSLILIAIAVAGLLLIACSNTSNLLLAFLTAREKEFAIRTSLGISRKRLVGQLIAETLLLSSGGGLLGLLLAYESTRYITRILPKGTLRGAVTLDWHVFVFTAAVALFTGLACVIVPAIRAFRFNVGEVLKDSGSTSFAGNVKHHQIYRFFVVVEIGLSLALLLTASTVIKGFWKLQHTDPGFRTDHILTAKIVLPQNEYPSKEQQARFFAGLLDRISSGTGISSAAATTNLPFGGSKMRFGFEIPGKVSKTRLSAEYSAISPHYFETLGIPILKGRDFDDHDGDSGPKTIIINKEMADQLFAGTDPIGQQIKLRFGDGSVREIVGVVGNVKHINLNDPAKLEFYVPYRQQAWSFMTVALHSSLPESNLVPFLRHSVLAIDPKLPIENVSSMKQFLADSVANPESAAVLIGILTVFALALSIIGVYGVTAYTVSQREREIGIRMSLGATPPVILRLFLWENFLNVVWGGLLGLLLFFSGFKLLVTVYPEAATGGYNVGLMTGTVLLLCLVAMAASYIAAQRATQFEPVQAIRAC